MQRLKSNSGLHCISHFLMIIDRIILHCIEKKERERGEVSMGFVEPRNKKAKRQEEEKEEAGGVPSKRP